MLCSQCGMENANGVSHCKQCGMPFAAPQASPAAPGGIPGYANPPAAPYGGPQPLPPMMIYPPPRGGAPFFPQAQPMKRAYQWPDICTLIGFISSLLGFFTFWLVLSPLGLILSILGYQKDKTRGFAVAGIIVALLSILIKIGLILYENDILPYWLTSGVFG